MESRSSFDWNLNTEKCGRGSLFSFDNAPRQGAAISHVVAQSAAGALDDPVGGEPLVPREAGLDGAVGVLDGGVVAEDDGALVGGVLVLGAVTHHLDALPHLIGTGGGQRSAVHDELAPGTDDETGGGSKVDDSCYC